MPFAATDTSFTHNSTTIDLHSTRYPRRSERAALLDDGIVDELAVERFAKGDSSVRLSPREVVCVVARMAAEGYTDFAIGDRFDSDQKWVQQVRVQHGILAARDLAAA